MTIFKMPKQQQHNHEWLEPEDNSLYHPDSDPRILENVCPACKELMDEWRAQIQTIMDSGA